LEERRTTNNSQPLYLIHKIDLLVITKEQSVASKRFSDKMEQTLNEQMNREAFQAQVYLSYASWAEASGFPGIAAFLYKHAVEERQHMFKFLKFINTRGGRARVGAIDAPPTDPTDMGDCLQKTLQHEIDNSKEIDKIVSLAYDDKDWATFNFGQWFVQEQIEEETLINELIDKYSLATEVQSDNANLYSLDRDLAEAPQEVPIPREEAL